MKACAYEDAAEREIKTYLATNIVEKKKSQASDFWDDIKQDGIRPLKYVVMPHDEAWDLAKDEKATSNGIRSAFYESLDRYEAFDITMKEKKQKAIDKAIAYLINDIIDIEGSTPDEAITEVLAILKR